MTFLHSAPSSATFSSSGLSDRLAFMEYTLIDSGKLLEEYTARWNERERIAVDFEGEFNLHIYGEHLCLIQINDGESYYIIDPRSPRMDRSALESFFTSPVKKVWFDCQSDSALVYRKYSLLIKNIFDVRVFALALGYIHNLASLEEDILGIKPMVGENKKKLQQTNWLKRPLEEEQIQYALEDVAHLMELEDRLVELAKEKGVYRDCMKKMGTLSHAPKLRPGWQSLGNWKVMKPEQKESVKQYYIARDTVARRFNVPSFKVLDKHLLLSFALSCPTKRSEVEELAQKANVRFQSQLRDCLLVAFDRLHGKA